MAELTFKSPGVSTKEIDLSGPTSISPTGVPAGIIGTSNQGPAFVPVTVATFADYMTIFGKTDGEKFGPLAMYEWMKNANAGTYLRVLGVGDGKKRLSSNGTSAGGQNISAGGVKNAGFIVGDRQVRRSTGLLNNNAYAKTSGMLGRTYFLGAFMSESNGSRYLSDAGIQGVPASVAASKTLTVGSRGMGADDTLVIVDGFGNTLTITVKATLYTDRSTYDDTMFTVGGAAPGSYTFAVDMYVGSMPSETTFSETIIKVIQAAAAYSTTGARLFVDADSYVAAGVTVAVRHTEAGTVGNSGTITANNVGGTFAGDLGLSTGVAVNLAGGTDGLNQAVPIIRGVLMAASGVLPTLSGNLSPNVNTASIGPMRGYLDGMATRYSAGHIGGAPNGAIACGGSNAESSYNFRLLLNGHINSSQYPNEIDVSLNPAKSNYISKVLNTDPAKTEQAGHVLYSHYGIETAQAVITGSTIGASYDTYRFTADSVPYEEVAFLMSSSLARNPDDSATTAKPNYENYSDRFQHAFSPTIVSQELGGKNKDLFTVHCLDAGAFTNTNVKVSVENIRKSKIDDDYGTFDLIVRKFADSDEAMSIVETGESFRGLSLDPTSNDYIARRIGTINKYYDFDKNVSSQKLVVDGVHPNLSRYIRVAMAGDVDNAEISKTALPVGFRGPYHLVTSGSSIFGTHNVPIAATSDGRVVASLFSEADDFFGRIVEPPIPYRQNISDGTGGKKKPNSSYYWGMQTTKVDSTTQPNSSRIFNEGIAAFTKYHPKFSTARDAPWVGSNVGKIDANGTVYDADKFNYNLFSLEKIQIHTKSSGDLVDFQEWGFAQYRRNGELLARRFMEKKDGTTDPGRFLNVAKDFGDIASLKYLKFTLPVQGGFDGVNVFDKDKSRMLDNACKREMEDTLQGQAEGPTVSTYVKALHVMAEKSDVDIQLLAVPGIRETKVTNTAIDQTESRFDALYVMDMEERDVDNLVVTSSIQEISVANTIEDLRGRALDTSFAATYFPDTIITDPTTQTNVRVPPSVSVLGALSYNDAVAFPWFAPAGFTRGALSDVFDTAVNFNRNNLDSLYESDINPITQFPSNPDHVIFGQKTLQAAASALDRVNVRRLLIDVRRKVRQVADTFIFEPNRASTLARFSASVNPILSQVQAQQGVERFKVIIDTTTTTQADIENNTVRGKIFLQPTRAVEFIALDFVVTNNGTEI